MSRNKPIFYYFLSLFSNLLTNFLFLHSLTLCLIMLCCPFPLETAWLVTYKMFCKTVDCTDCVWQTSQGKPSDAQQSVLTLPALFLKSWKKQDVGSSDRLVRARLHYVKPAVRQRCGT